MPEEGQGLGSAYVEIGGDLSDLERAVRSAETLVGSLGATTTATGKTIGAAFDGVSTTFKDVNGRLRDANGRFVKTGAAAAKLGDEVGDAVRPAKRFGSALRSAADDAAASVRQFDKAAASFEVVGDRLTDVGRGLSLKVTAPIVGAGVGLVKLASDFETAFAGVEKTVDGTASELAALRSGILDLSKTLPASAGAISGVAEAAGQLGIETRNVLAFSEVMIGLGEATNLSATEAASGLARFANITGASQSDFDRLGSTIVALGNNFATTESEILGLALRLSAAGKQVGFTEAQTLGLAAALSSLGVEAEAGGSALSKTLLDVQAATQTGGAALEAYARIAGQTADEFKASFARDATGALETFLAGLGKIQRAGGNVTAALESIGVQEVRQRDALLRLAGASDLVADAFDSASGAFRDNSALAEETAKRYKTFGSQLAILRNQAAAAALPLGEELVGALRDVLPALGSAARGLEGALTAFRALPSPVKIGAASLVGFAAAAGPAALASGALVRSLGALSAASLSASASVRVLAASTRLLLKVSAGLAVGFAIGAAIDALRRKAEDAEPRVSELAAAMAKLRRETAGATGAGLVSAFAELSERSRDAKASVAALQGELAALESAGLAVDAAGLPTAEAKRLTAEIAGAKSAVNALGTELEGVARRGSSSAQFMLAAYENAAAGLRDLTRDLSSAEQARLERLDAKITELRGKLSGGSDITIVDPGKADELANALAGVNSALSSIDARRTLGVLTPLEAAEAKAQTLASGLTSALGATGGRVTAEVTALAAQLATAEASAKQLGDELQAVERAATLKADLTGLGTKEALGAVSAFEAAEDRVRLYAQALDDAVGAGKGLDAPEVKEAAANLEAARREAERAGRALDLQNAFRGDIGAQVQAGLLTPLAAAEGQLQALRRALASALASTDAEAAAEVEELTGRIEAQTAAVDELRAAQERLAATQGLAEALKGTETARDLGIIGPLAEAEGKAQALEQALADALDRSDGRRTAEVEGLAERLRVARAEAEKLRVAFDAVGAFADTAARGIGDAFTEGIGRAFGLLSDADRLTLSSLDEAEAQLREAFADGSISAEDFRLRLEEINDEREALATGLGALVGIGKGAFAALVNGLKALIGELAVAIARTLILKAIFSAFGGGGGFLGLIGGAAGELGGFSAVAGTAGAAARTASDGFTDLAASAGTIEQEIGGASRSLLDAVGAARTLAREVGGLGDGQETVFTAETTGAAREAERLAATFADLSGSYALALTASSDEADDAISDATERALAFERPYTALLSVEADEAERALAAGLDAFRALDTTAVVTLEAETGGATTALRTADAALGAFAARTFTASLAVDDTVVPSGIARALAALDAYTGDYTATLSVDGAGVADFSGQLQAAAVDIERLATATARLNAARLTDTALGASTQAVRVEAQPTEVTFRHEFGAIDVDNDKIRASVAYSEQKANRLGRRNTGGRRGLRG